MEQLKEAVQKEITSMFTKILDYVQVGVGATDQYKVLRAKILRAGNDAIRNLHNFIDQEED